MTTTPIIVAADSRTGSLTIAGPAATMEAAFDGAAPLDIAIGNATGETVWLAPQTRQVWRDDAISSDRIHVHHEVNHPEHGRIIYAHLDTDRLEAAPVVASVHRDIRARIAATRASMDRPATPAPTRTATSAQARTAAASHGIKGEIWD